MITPLEEEQLLSTIADAITARGFFEADGVFYRKIDPIRLREFQAAGDLKMANYIGDNSKGSDQWVIYPGHSRCK